MKSKGINQQSNNNKWHIKTKKISIYQLLGVRDSCLKKNWGYHCRAYYLWRPWGCWIKVHRSSIRKLSSFRPPNWLFSQDGHIGFQNMANMLVSMARWADKVVVKKKCSEVCARWIEFLHYIVNFQQMQPHFSWMRSFVNVLRTSSICFASSLVGVIMMAPTWIKRGEF